MLTLNRAGQTGVICLTAFMTLIAGMPHFDCRCPDGRLKRYCLSVFFNTGCCCNGSCCLAARNAQPAQGKKAECTCCSCCSTPGPLTGLRRAGCQKTLIEAAPAEPRCPELAAPDVTTHPLVTTPPSELSAGAKRTGDYLPADWRHRRPPPDRIIILQHFLV